MKIYILVAYGFTAAGEVETETALFSARDRKEAEEMARYSANGLAARNGWTNVKADLSLQDREYLRLVLRGDLRIKPHKAAHDWQAAIGYKNGKPLPDDDDELNADFIC